MEILNTDNLLYQLFGYNPPQPVYPSARRLKLADPRVVNKYIDILHQSMLEHGLFARMDNVHRRACIIPSEQILSEYEEVYALSMELMHCKLPFLVSISRNV